MDEPLFVIFFVQTVSSLSNVLQTSLDNAVPFRPMIWSQGIKALRIPGSPRGGLTDFANYTNLPKTRN